MPAPGEILHGLRSIASQAAWLSVLWHIVVAVTIAALLAGFRPRRRTAAASLSVPLASVSIVAFAFENPFNGAVFAVLALLLAGLASGASTARVTLGSRWAVVLGSLLFAFGWVYPHFLENAPWFAYLYSAPLGAIPCPTLSAVVGVALIGDGLGTGPWRLTLAVAALFYAVFGMFRLGVVMDSVLLLGGVALLAEGRHLQADRAVASGGLPGPRL